MVEAQPVTETVILRFRKDVKSENITSDSTVRQAFVELTDTTKAFSGFIRQYWVYHTHSVLPKTELTQLYRDLKSSIQPTLYGV